MEVSLPLLDYIKTMLLQGKKGLVIGIANKHSIAYGCAKVFHEQGAQLAITYLNDKAKPYVQPLAQALQSPLFLPCDFNPDFPLGAPAVLFGPWRCL